MSIDEARQKMMLEVVTRHARTEGAKDLDGVMATLVPDPVYILHNGLRIEGYDNVREFYRRLFVNGTLDDNAGGKGLTGMWAGENTVMVEADMTYPTPDGARAHVTVAATFPFRGELATGEIVSIPSEFHDIVTAHMPDFSDLASPPRSKV